MVGTAGGYPAGIRTGALLHQGQLPHGSQGVTYSSQQHALRTVVGCQELHSVMVVEPTLKPDWTNL
jgi:hypothetical protein